MRKVNRILTLLIFICTLCYLFNLYLNWESAEEKLAPYQGEKLKVTGYVDYSSYNYDGARASFLLQVLEAHAGNRAITYRQKIRINMEGKLPEAKIVCVEGTLKELSFYRNPGGFDAKTWNWVQEIGGRINNVQLLASGGELSWLQKIALYNYALRQDLEKSLDELRQNPILAPIMAGMVLGGSSQLDDESRTIFVNNGLAHLLSVSGSHLLILSSLATTLLTLLFKPLPNRQRLIEPLLMLLMVLYALLCGLRPPIVRAVIMSILLLFIGKHDTMHAAVNKGLLIIVTALLLLSYKPLWLFDLGFQLSFLCALGIAYLAPLLEIKLKGCTFLDDSLKTIFSVTLAAQLAALPLEIAHFHQVSIVAFISNIILVPILELCTLLTLGGLFLNEMLFVPAAFLLEQVLAQGRFLACLPGSTMVIGHLPVWCILIYYALVLLLLDIPITYCFTSKEKQLMALTLSLVLLSTYWYEHLRPQPLQAYFLDVGQGDATLIRTPHGKLVLVDTGGLKNYPTGSKIIAPTVRYLDKSNIDLLVLTHWDYDHVGGTVSLAKQVRIDRLVYSEQRFADGKEDMQGRELKDVILNLSSIEYKEKVVAGNTYVCDGVEFKILHAGDGSLAGNAASIVLSIDDKLLLMGDLPKDEEVLLNVGRHEVLKLGHHGSNTSTSSELLDKVQPKIGIVSCGRNNMYGHPHKDVRARLRDRNIAMHRIDLEGCIVYEVK